MVRKPKPPASDLFSNSREAETVPLRRVRWGATYRLIPSRYPPIDLFERIAPRDHWDTLQRLESMTNSQVREAVGNISLVPKEKRVNGPGASIVMAPFTHCSQHRPTRFSDGSFGIYYAGRKLETALAEVAFHMGRFHAATDDPAAVDQYRAFKGAIDRPMHDIRGGGYSFLLRPDTANYGKPQSFAEVLRNADSNGIVYPSVRHRGGECIGAFWPNVVTIPQLDRHVDLKWDGTTMTEWFDRRKDTWRPLPR
jgi:hypothetical protein